MKHFTRNLCNRRRPRMLPVFGLNSRSGCLEALFQAPACILEAGVSGVAIVMQTIRILLVFFCMTLGASANSTDIRFPERNVGYSIGDILEQTIVLNADPSTLPLKALSETQRQGRWLARHSIEIDDEKLALTIRYQIINAPSDTRLIWLPAITLGDDPSTAISAPAWPFSVSALIPAIPSTEENPLALIQDDHLAKAINTHPRKQRMKLIGYALVASLLVWLAWWLIRRVREAQLLPFARAHRTIRKLASTSDKHAAESWLALHDAFNQAGGRQIGHDSVAQLLTNKPWLKPLEQDIKTFFVHSSTRFFSPDPAQDTLDLAALSKNLYKAEKRHTARFEKTANTAQSIA